MEPRPPAPEAPPSDTTGPGATARRGHLWGWVGLAGGVGAALLVAAVLLVGCCRSRQVVFLEAPPPVPPQPAADAAAQLPSPVAVPDTVTLTEMRNVHFRVDGALALGIRHLRGALVSTRAGEPVNFGDKGSFRIEIHDAEAGLTVRDLSALLNRYTFAYPGAPLRDLWITTAGDQIVQEGVLHKGVDVPFTIVADLSATPEGNVRLHPTSIRICDVPGGGLLDALGLDLGDLLDLSQARGVSVDGNDLVLDPDHLLPPPAMTGRVTAARVEGDEVVLTFGSRDDALSRAIRGLSRPDPEAPDYLFFRGGTLHFGNLFMVQANLQIVDETPEDPFDFYIDRYIEQLAAGYSKTGRDLGLRAYLPDFEDLGGAAGATVVPAAATRDAP